jgi:hypothetical protein
MSDAKLRRLFEVAASLVDEKQKAHSSDEETMVWLTRLVKERRVKQLAENAWLRCRELALSR